MAEITTVAGVSIPNPVDRITVAGTPLKSLQGTTVQSAGAAIGSAARRMGQTAVNQAVGRATSFVNNKIQSGIDRAMSFLPTSLANALGANEHEDFNRLRQINKQLVHTDFVYDWNFKLEIEGAPSDLDFYVKDLTVSMADIGTDEEKYGAASMNWPSGDNVLRLSMTLRENTDMRIATFFGNWIYQVMPGNGNVGLPLGPMGYVRRIAVYNIDVAGNELPYLAWSGYPTQVGEMSRSRENGQFMELPVTITQFSSMGS